VAELEDQTGVISRQLIHQIAELQERRPPPPNASLQDRIIALAPGSPPYNELLWALKHELQQTLPSVGAILNPNQSITLTKRNISDEIIEALKRAHGREIDSKWLTDYADNLRQRFPSISNAVLAQMLASVEGVDAGKVQRLLVEHEGDTRAETEVEVEYEMSGDEERPNVIARPKMKKRSTSAQSKPAPSRTTEKTPSQTPRPMTESDLAVLKRVPRKNRDRRLSA